ncbi:hypothetical protein [Photorhabdus viridis]|uniref:hypothetical protein n=1 Tax=Photorhabdus viridis TaxID=3163327 RepID=UPI0033079E55
MSLALHLHRRVGEVKGVAIKPVAGLWNKQRTGLALVKRNSSYDNGIFYSGLLSLAKQLLHLLLELAFDMMSGCGGMCQGGEASPGEQAFVGR